MQKYQSKILPVVSGSKAVDAETETEVFSHAMKGASSNSYSAKVLAWLMEDKRAWTEPPSTKGKTILNSVDKSTNLKSISESSSLKYSRYNLFKNIIISPVADVRALRELSWNGIPSRWRPDTWKLLLGYLPANASRRESALQRKRREYTDFVEYYYDLINSSPSSNNTDDTLRQIRLDVPRTSLKVGLFTDSRIRLCLERILFVWAMRHPASSYVQGMNDLATPVFTLFITEYFRAPDSSCPNFIEKISEDALAMVEADTYWCLAKILSRIEDHYIPDQPGIQRMIGQLENLLDIIDVDLSRHLRINGVDILHVSFKWMNCLFVRELSLPCVMRLWDTYLSENDSGFDEFHVYVCLAYLLHFSPQLLTLESEELYGFWLGGPSDEWSEKEVEILNSQAYVWRSMYGGSKAHLSCVGTHTIESRAPNVTPEKSTMKNGTEDADDSIFYGMIKSKSENVAMSNTNRSDHDVIIAASMFDDSYFLNFDY